jgi:hypothetical protein
MGYSCRSAAIGSIRAALLAGRKLAKSAVISRTAASAKVARSSDALTPNSRLWNNDQEACAAQAPSAAPIETSRNRASAAISDGVSRLGRAAALLFKPLWQLPAPCAAAFIQDLLTISVDILCKTYPGRRCC